MRRNNDFSSSDILFQQITQIIGDRDNVIVIKRRHRIIYIDIFNP